MSYDQLRTHVMDERLQMVHVSAVPRSISTAFVRALGESADNGLHVNEPFNKITGDPQIAARHILQAFDSVDPDQAPDKPVVVATKSIAHHMPPDVVRDWFSISRGVVIMVRDPLIQMGSLATRMANDILHGKGSDLLSQREIGGHMSLVESMLIKDDFKKTGWQAIGEHYDELDAVGGSSVVIDAGALLARPEQVLMGACTMLDLQYHERMAHGWGKNFRNANSHYTDSYDTHGRSTSAWIRDAVTTDGLEPNNRQPLELGQMPYFMRKHVEEVAMPNYQRISDKALR